MSQADQAADRMKAEMQMGRHEVEQAFGPLPCVECGEDAKPNSCFCWECEEEIEHELDQEDATN